MADADLAANAIQPDRQPQPQLVVRAVDAADERDESAAVATRPSDETLVLAARRDARAIARLYERYADTLYRYALARSASAAVADDVVSETFVAVLETLERFDPLRGSFAAWLFTIASRRLSDHTRRERRFWRAISRRWSPPTPADDTLDTLVRREDAERLRAALARLPDDERELLLLRYAAGLTSTQIGELRGLSPGATRMRLGRLREHLALDLGDEA